MPIIEKSGYKRKPFYLINEHFETIYASLFRKVNTEAYQAERLELADGDFLDIGWIRKRSRKCIIISHGLEGNMHRPYVLGMAKVFSENGWDVLAWNYRSCGKDMNRLKRLYHHGNSDDLEVIIHHALSKGYESVAMTGLSMGGSTILKYLGEQGDAVPDEVIGGAVFSVPCNLYDSAVQLTYLKNKLYKDRFLKKLIDKIKRKALQYPDIDLSGIDDIKDFKDFDERYTAPLHGFRDAMDFYESATSDQFYEMIKKPVLLVNALNDPLLGEKCYPYGKAEKSDYLYLETPAKGGHVGFTISGRDQTWSELRAYDFISQLEKEVAAGE
ncbi:MAG: alpha/beta fold hydrolase [Cyclobacteriaceae bacterium]